MDKDEQIIFEKIQNLKTVRKPVPSRMDEVELSKDIQKVQPYLNLVTSGLEHDKAMIIDALVKLIITVQRKFFNRSLWQTTAYSLGDSITSVISEMVDRKKDLIQILKMTINLASYLAKHHLVMDSQDLVDRMLERVSEKRPKLVEELFESTLNDLIEDDNFDDDYPEAPLRITEFLQNDPIRLLRDEDSYLFSQNSHIDFNQFIEKIYKKHSKSQLFLAYSFFSGPKEVGSQILDYAMNWPASKARTYELSYVFNFVIALDLNLNGVINLSKVFHQFMKFCQDQELITDNQYREVLKEGNDAILSMITDQIGFNKDRSTKKISIWKKADEIFSKPDHTINVKKATEILADLDWTNKSTVVERMTQWRPKQIKLSKKLNQHQLDLELKKANIEIENLKKHFPMLNDISELKDYENFVIKIHTKMVRKYNRRLRNWTMESLIDCLETLYRTNHKIYEYPAHLRYLELYISQLDDDHAIGSFSSLTNGLEIATGRYLTLGINWFSNAR